MVQLPGDSNRWVEPHSQQLPQTLQGLLLHGNGRVPAAVRQHRQVVRGQRDHAVLQETHQRLRGRGGGASGSHRREESLDVKGVWMNLCCQTCSADFLMVVLESSTRRSRRARFSFAAHSLECFMLKSFGEECHFIHSRIHLWLILLKLLLLHL